MRRKPRKTKKNQEKMKNREKKRIEKTLPNPQRQKDREEGIKCDNETRNVGAEERRECPRNIEEISSSINGREGLRDEVNDTPIGSGPPNCYLKCNGCIPCDPVLVTVPPRELVGTQAESYPQIWKCQCQGSFYDPWP
ncbi:hypothetical protein H6P81_017507 [Aristolochia fimbriata]|uniref:Epidermal patterning factor-like protein n=1 Tax=Aristolochia fimbriata TaxID=158543 RepID=A0AAV7DYN0_ARIFI|nr:hypothetical protein H6P81_017507 [Aristolochia fimbriata]